MNTSAQQSLTLCTYNCNNLHHVRRYPRGEKSIDGVLRELGADIVCFQETKLSADDLQPMAFASLASVPGWDSYFCFSRKGGYSGVATFSRMAASTVRAAEEGLLRILPPQNPVCAAAEHAAAAAAGAGAGAEQQAGAGAGGPCSCWPQEIAFPEAELRHMFTAEEATAVDKDGRCVITDHGLFVLFNVYLPACTGHNGAEQVEVKRNMTQALDVRIRALLAAGRHVVVAGDFNAVLPWWGEEPQRAPALSSESLASLPADSPAEAQQQQQQQQKPHMVNLPAAGEREVFAPLALYMRGKAALPTSGLQEWLLRMTAPPGDHPACSGGGGGEGGLLIDTLKHLNPGVMMFRYPDPKRPGCFKERPPYTAWNQARNIRNDAHGGRGDYLFVADAAQYAERSKRRRPAAALAAEQQHQQHQQQEEDGADPPLPLAECLHSAYILRELRWTDHAPVVLELRLPPAAAALLQQPPRMASRRHGQGQGRGADQAAAAAGAALPPPAPAAAAAPAPEARAAAGAGTLPRSPLSTAWLLDQPAAATAAAAIFATAGLGQPPAQVLTCDSTALLRQRQRQEAEQLVQRRAQAAHAEPAPAAAGGRCSSQQAAPGQAGAPAAGPQLPAPAAAAGPSHQLPGAPGAERLVREQPQGNGGGCGAGRPQGGPPAAAGAGTQPPRAHAAAALGTRLGTCPQQQPALQRGVQQLAVAAAAVAAAAVAVERAPGGKRRRRQEQQQEQEQEQQQRKGHPPPTSAPGRHQGAAGRSRRGWRTVRLDNGKVATIACSSSDEDSG